MSVERVGTTAPPGQWKLDYESDDSDDSLDSHLTTSDKIEDELNAIDGETGFKSLRAAKMFSEAKQVLQPLKFVDVEDVDDVQKKLQLNERHFNFQKLPNEKKLVSLLARNSNVVSLKLSTLDNNGVKALSSVLKSNASIRLVVVAKSDEVSEEIWELLAESLEGNYSLVFFVDSLRESHFSKLEANHGLEKVRKIVYRNQQLCETAFKSVKSSGEVHTFRHCQITVLGDKEVGKTEVIKKLFHGGQDMEDLDRDIEFRRYFLLPEQKSYKWTYSPPRDQQFSTMFCHRFAAKKVHEFIAEQRESRRVEITSLTMNEAQPLTPVVAQNASPPTNAIHKSSSFNKNKKFHSFSLSPIKLFGRLTKQKEEDKQQARLTPRVKIPNYPEDLNSLTSSLDPTTGQRTVITKHNKMRASDQVCNYFRALDMYSIKPTSQTLANFDWLEMFDCLNNQDKTLVSILDFKTNNAYYSCSNMFLSKNSSNVVLLCFNLKTMVDSKDKKAEFGRLLFWLRKVQKCSPSSSIFLIGTHLDMLSNEPTLLLEDVNSDMMRFIDTQEFPTIVTGKFMFYPLSTQTSIELDEFKLKNKISKKIIKITNNDYNTKIPVYWFKVLDSLTRNATVKCSNGHPLVKVFTSTVERVESDIPETCTLCSTNLDELNATVEYTCNICEKRVCFQCHDTLIGAALGNETNNPSQVTVAKLYKNCMKYKMSPVEAREMLKYMARNNFVAYASSTKLLAKYIILKPSWLLENISKAIVSENILTKGARYNMEYQNLSKFSLEHDYENLVDNGIASNDLLSHLWGKRCNFFVQLLFQYRIIDNWKVGVEQNYIIFDMLKNMSEDEFRTYTNKVDVEYLQRKSTTNELSTARFTFSYLDNAELEVDLFRKVVCSIVEQGRNLHNIDFKDNETPSPEMVQEYARVYFLAKTPVLIQKRNDMVIDFKVYKDEEFGDIVLHRIEAILRQLNTDVLQNHLSWKISVTKQESKKLISLEKAKKSKVQPWFTGTKHKSTTSRNKSTIIDADVNLNDFLEL